MKSPKLLTPTLLLLTMAFLMACGKKGENTTTDSGDSCPDKTELKIKSDTLALNATLSNLSAQITEKGEGFVRITLKNYEGKYKTTLTNDELNLRITLSTDHSAKPRPAIKEGRYSMAAKDVNGTASFELSTASGRVMSWWTAGGVGKDNIFEVDLLKLTDKEVCLQIKGNCIQAQYGGSQMEGTVKASF